MNRNNLLKIINEVKHGGHTSESLRQEIIETRFKPKDARGMLQVQGIELCFELVKLTNPDFLKRLEARQKEYIGKYGDDQRTWPDGVLDECCAIYQEDPIFARYSDTECFLNVNNLKEFIKWAQNELQTLKS